MGFSIFSIFSRKMKILIYGSQGWIGGLFIKYLESVGVDYIRGEVRVDSKEYLLAEINEHYAEYRAAARAYDDASKKYVARDVREDYLQEKQADFRNATHKFLAWLETIKS